MGEFCPGGALAAAPLQIIHVSQTFFELILVSLLDFWEYKYAKKLKAES
jgi:hypothetical protein